MIYEKLKWIHLNPRYPILIYRELDDNRWERRKVEVYESGHYSYASEEEPGSPNRFGEELILPDAKPPFNRPLWTGLSEIPVPTLDQIASDPEFEGVNITKEEFEEMWAKRKVMIRLTDKLIEGKV